MHESAARTVDEELDRDLILEDAPNESGTEEDSDDGKLGSWSTERGYAAGENFK